MLNELEKYLSLAIEQNASDTYLTGGQRPFLRTEGKMEAVCDEILNEQEVNDFLNLLIRDRQREILQEQGAVDFSHTYKNRRFRGNAYYQREQVAIVLRLLSNRFFSPEEIGLSNVFPTLLKIESGLILVTGKVGSGKTTTMATFIESINSKRGAHIITLEDPIEYIYEPKRAFISQREFGVDFFDFAKALKHALREMPDIVLVGEIRDRETMRTALMAAETGILVLGTLHTKSAAETALRVEGMFDKEECDSVRAEFAEAISAIISQELILGKDNRRLPLTEIMLKTPAAKNLIRQGKYSQLNSVILGGKNLGMQTKEAALNRLFKEGKITSEVFNEIKTD